MKKIILFLIVLLCSVFNSFGQNLQFSQYTYSDLCYITKAQNGSVFIRKIGFDEAEPISVVIDENGFKKLVNDNYSLFILDGMDQRFISPKIKVSAPVLFPDGKYRIPDCHMNGRHIKNVTASSTLTDKYHTYSAEGTLTAWYSGDCDIWGFVKDCIPWVEGKDDYGIGEYIEFELDYSSYRSNDYDGWIIEILNGYVNPEKPHLYKQNSRIKKASVFADGKKVQDVCFNDYVELTNIKIPGNIQKVKIVIDEVYEGSKYKDTCITGISAARY